MKEGPERGTDAVPIRGGIVMIEASAAGEVEDTMTETVPAAMIAEAGMMITAVLAIVTEIVITTVRVSVMTMIAVTGGMVIIQTDLVTVMIMRDVKDVLMAIRKATDSVTAGQDVVMMTGDIPAVSATGIMRQGACTAESAADTPIAVSLDTLRAVRTEDHSVISLVAGEMLPSHMVMIHSW